MGGAGLLRWMQSVSTVVDETSCEPVVVHATTIVGAALTTADTLTTTSLLSTYQPSGLRLRRFAWHDNNAHHSSPSERRMWCRHLPW
jgi:hypothetical protein